MPTLAAMTKSSIKPALKLLPKQMDSREARVLLLAIGLQESGFEHRWQVIDRRRPNRKGPARGFWQFELGTRRSEEHTSELQSLMRISYAVFCLKKKKNKL